MTLSEANTAQNLALVKDFRTQAVRQKEPATRKGSNKKHLKAYTTPFRGRFTVGVFVVTNI